ncbi:oxidoreductase [Sphingobacterium alkalisoli]|uniref:Oxidoreductase n=1 Tax=Sphingobacterium alkalisoli TaxID=1874115 RepID=A0A4U0H2E5_9SPHI|nr:YCF48-related protein [Sphingobacterium alkalisoli]TJY65636.1 oxidoreductase [Sphingobacterium alkalisoli]GGH19286.1 oxidoreductase [Sphingobacterium alkalisoli]
MIRNIVLSYALLFACFFGHAQTFTLAVQKDSVSFRGLDTFGENVVWVSGSKGTVGYSKDAGSTWVWVSPQGYEYVDFRDIKAFSAKEAIILSAGAPAVILRTTNGGKSWNKVFSDDREEVFFDAMDFEGKTGYVLGDPLDGSFQLLKSTNNGKSWNDISNQMYLIADKGEVAFAASGSSVQLLNGVLYIGTGGTYASLFNYDPKNLRVDKFDCPIWSGSSSTGIFAIDFYDQQTGIVVGGDYQQDQDNRNNVLITRDAGKSWTKPQVPVSGFRSDVLFLSKETVIATGTSGTDLSTDGGMKWKNISTLSFNTIAKSKSGKKMYLTNSKGQVYMLTL